ncbi:MAG: DUF4255 domain-containing protein [Deltaproteobacteria bacterium]|jgi:hypothetical protein|nr:DUF4255 domain-containing protein [Deltaproteobacteria bacterium]
MKPNLEYPISSATSALNNYFVKNINEQETSLENFSISNDHPSNINDHEHPNLNIYPFLVNLAPDFQNVTRSDVRKPLKAYPLRLHFLLSATGDHTKLVPHILIDNAIKTVIERPLLEIEEYNYTLQMVLVPINTEESANIWTALKCSHRMSIVLSIDIAYKGSTDSS